MNLFLFLLMVLAVWRFTHMIYEETGPRAIFERLHGWVATWSEERGGAYDMINCFYCLSAWISFIPAFFLANSFGAFILYSLAISGGASIVQKIIEKLESEEKENF